MRTRVLLSLVVLACATVSLQAAEPFVILVDELHGLLLIPEGSAVPSGIDFQITSEARGSRSRVTADGVAVDAVEVDDAAVPRRFVYAYAAPEKFVEPRRRIAEAEAKFPHPAVELVPASGDQGAGSHASATGRWQTATNIADVDQTYYYDFWDGSYHAIRKYIYHSNGIVGYTAYGWVYSEAGNWDTKVVVNNTTVGGTPYWNQSKTCNFYNASGTCLPAVWYTGAGADPLIATVTSQAALTRYLYPPCDLPCKSNSSSTLSVSFP